MKTKQKILYFCSNLQLHSELLLLSEMPCLAKVVQALAHTGGHHTAPADGKGTQAPQHQARGHVCKQVTSAAAEEL